MCFCIRPWVCFRYACLKSTLCMLLHLSALIALLRGLSLSPPRCPCPVFCLYLSVEACLSPSLPFAVFALRLVGCDNVCCSSLVLCITAGSGRFPAVNSQSIYVPFGLVNSKKKKKSAKRPLAWLTPATVDKSAGGPPAGFRMSRIGWLSLVSLPRRWNHMVPCSP